MSACLSGDDALSKEIEAGLIRLQVRLGELMSAEYERDEMTEEQLAFILEWIGNLSDMTMDEAKAQLEAWFQWRDETHPAWRWQK